MNKAHIVHLLTDYLEGTLPHAGMEKVKAHLSFCNACKQALADIQENSRLLAATPRVGLSDHLEEEIVNQVQSSSRESGSTSDFHWPRWRINWGYTRSRAALLIVLTTILILLTHNKLTMSDNHEIYTTASRSRITTNSPIPSPSPMPTVEVEVQLDNNEWEEEPVPQSNTTLPVAAPSTPTVQSIWPIMGSRSGIQTPLNMMVSNAEEWADVWKRHTVNNPSEQAPVVDFSSHSVIALFAGPCPTGGYKIEIADIVISTDSDQAQRKIAYQISGPPPGVLSAQVISYPYLLKLEPRFVGRTVFESTSTIAPNK